MPTVVLVALFTLWIAKRFGRKPPLVGYVSESMVGAIFVAKLALALGVKMDLLQLETEFWVAFLSFLLTLALIAALVPQNWKNSELWAIGMTISVCYLVGVMLLNMDFMDANKRDLKLSYFYWKQLFHTPFMWSLVQMHIPEMANVLSMYALVAELSNAQRLTAAFLTVMEVVWFVGFMAPLGFSGILDTNISEFFKSGFIALIVLIGLMLLKLFALYHNWETQPKQKD